MNLVQHLLWATCVLVISQHAESAIEQGTEQKPKIHSITFSPPSPVKKRVNVVATALFYSPGPVPICLWKMNFTKGAKMAVKDQLWPLSKNEYKINVSLGPIDGPGWVGLDVVNKNGTDRMEVAIDVVLEFDDYCNSASVCAVNHVCDEKEKVCLCRQGYRWDSSTCSPYFFDPCDVSETCQAATKNSKCHPEKKKCICDPDYGVDYDRYYINEFDVECTKYPIRKVKKVAFEKEVRLRCQVADVNLTDLLWFRNGGKDLCTDNSSWCSQNKTVLSQDSYRRDLVTRVIRNDTYTCMAVTSEGAKWTVTETEIIAGHEPEIRELTLSPPGRQPSGTEMVVLARIFSPTEITSAELRISYRTNDLKEELTVLSDNEYELRKSLGAIPNRTRLRLHVKNEYGQMWKDLEIDISNEPLIHNITFSPPRPVEKRGEVVATAHLYSPTFVPTCQWEVMFTEGDKYVVKDELWYLAENEYISNVSLGPIDRAGFVSFQVNGVDGTDRKEVEIGAVLEFGETCNSASVCATNFTECKRGRCVCRAEYQWNSSSSTCRPYLFDHCNTSEFCQAVTKNSECHPEKKKCFCDAGYGLDYEGMGKRVLYDADCIKYPIRKSKTMEFDKKTRFICKVANSNLKEILWFRNGQELCTTNSILCSQDETTAYEDDIKSYSRGLELSVIRNDTYTCMAVASDGRNWTVSETEITVVFPVERTRYTYTGDNQSIDCVITTPNLEIRLVRDGTESCTPNASWCHEENVTYLGSSRGFKILNLQANHTFTCEIYKGDEKLVTASVLRIQIGGRPEIRELTITPPGRQPRGTELVAVARIYSPTGNPTRRWSLFYNDTDLKEGLITVLPDNEYEIRLSLGRFRGQTSFGETTLYLYVENDYGQVKKTVTLYIGTKLGEECSSDCMDDNAECKGWPRRCECRQGYFLNKSSFCDKRAQYLAPCETTEQCQAVNDNSECDDQTKRCFCRAGYQHNRWYCNYHSIKYENARFQQDATLDCQVVTSNLSDIIWYRNDKEICTHGSTWCSQEENITYTESLYMHSRKLILPNVIKNDRYTCRAFTSSGKNWTVSDTQIVIKYSPEQRTKPSVYGSNAILDCDVKTLDSFDMKLFRDDRDVCTHEATWCSQVGSTRDFEVLNLRANHTFTCAAYSGKDKLVTVKAHHILIDTKPQILEMTHSPPGAVEPGITFFVTARFYSLQKEEPVRRWKIDGVEKYSRDDELTAVAENEYESKLPSSQVEHTNEILFEVSDIYGRDTKHMKVDPAVQFGHHCSSNVMCVTDNTECDPKSELCLCREGYHWDRRICQKNGTMGVLAVQKEGITMLILAILFTLCRSTT